MKIKFTKMVGSGNDFIVIDNLSNKVGYQNSDMERFTSELCQRRFNIGADGVLLIEKSKKADFKMRILNPDGGEVSMCGNGARCAARFAYQNNIAGENMKIETLAGILRAKIIGGKVKVKMTSPKDIRLGFSLDLGEKKKIASFVNTGVEHVVIFVDNVEKVNVVKLGSHIRYHRLFEPAGTNVNFAQILDENTIKVRTYERGVENETLACGTGATASAIISHLLHKMKSPIDVITRGGRALTIHFSRGQATVSNVYMEGDANIAYNGRFDYV